MHNHYNARMSAHFEDDENLFEDDDSGFDESSGSLDGQIATYLTRIQEAQDADRICFLIGENITQRINPTDPQPYLIAMIEKMRETDEYFQVTTDPPEGDMRILRDNEVVGNTRKRIDWFKSSQRLRTIRCMSHMNIFLQEEGEDEKDLNAYTATEALLEHYETYESENIEHIRTLVLELLAMGHITGYRMLAANFINKLQQTRQAIFETIFDEESIEQAQKIAGHRLHAREFIEMTSERITQIQTIDQLMKAVKGTDQNASLLAYLGSFDFAQISENVRTIVIELTNNPSFLVANIARNMLKENGYWVLNGKWQRKGVNH